jgi:hypothetical protein
MYLVKVGAGNIAFVRPFLASVGRSDDGTMFIDFLICGIKVGIQSPVRQLELQKSTPAF